MQASTTTNSSFRLYLMRLGHAFGEGWNSFWFTPTDAFPVCVLRILVGLLGIGYVLSYMPDLLRWFGPDGMLPAGVVKRLVENPGGEAIWRFSLINPAMGSTSLWLMQITALLVMLALTVGLFSRLSNLLALLFVLSYVHRVPMLAGPAEAVLSMLLVYLLLTSSGVYLSVDRWRRERRPGDSPDPAGVGSNIGLRLIQVHTAAFYVMTGLTMLGSRAWWSGEAMWRLIGSSESRLVDLTALARHIYLTDAWTHVVVGFMLVFGLLIWKPIARPLLLVAAACVWGMLALVSGQLFLAASMLVASAAFYPYPGRSAPATD